jgi:hypothetical protein
MAKARHISCPRRIAGRSAMLALAILGALLAWDLALAQSSATPAPSPQPVTPAPAPVQVPLSEFANRPPSRLAGVHAKLTYLSEQKKPVPTVVFGSFQRLPDMAAFKPYQTPGLHYGNDNFKNIENFSVDLAELKAMLQKANTIPAVQQGKRDGKFLAFVVVDTTPGEVKGLEVALNQADAKALVTALQTAAFPSNGMAKQILTALLTRL